MGVYISCFTDNNIFENDIQQFVDKIAYKLKRKIWLLGEFNDNKYPEDEWYDYFRHNEINEQEPLTKYDKFIEKYPELINKHNELFNGGFYYLTTFGENLMYKNENGKTYYMFGHLTPEKLAKFLEDDIANGVNSIPERFKDEEMTEEQLNGN